MVDLNLALLIPTAVLALLVVVLFVVYHRYQQHLYDYHDSSEYQITQLQKKTLDFGITYSDLSFSRLLGKGSQGEVFLATWRGLSVAVKKIDTTIVPHEIVEEFCQEADIMRRLRHPCLTLFLGVSLEAPHLCIVTELVDRGSLFDIIHEESGGMTWRKAIGIATDVAAGITYLHSHSPPIIHRDLKSLNILIAKNWRAKVSDFGMTRFSEAGGGVMTQCGSPLWMAPEMIRNEAYTEAADTYSFGIVLWELYTHEIPYRRLNYSPSQLVVKVVKDGLRPELPKGMPKQYLNLMQRCWAANPEERPKFKDILKELEEMRENPLILNHKPRRRRVSEDDDDEESDEFEEEEPEIEEEPSALTQAMQTPNATSYQLTDMHELEIFPTRFLPHSHSTATSEDVASARDMFEKTKQKCLIYKGKYRGKQIIVKKYACFQVQSPSIVTSSNDMSSVAPSSPSSASRTFTIPIDSQHLDTQIWAIMKRYSEVRHPNLVLFMGAYIEYDHVGVVEEEVARGSLSRLLVSTPTSFSWDLCLTVMIDTAQALQYLHHDGIIHPHLASDRVLISATWRAKIRDYMFIDLSKKLTNETDVVDEFTAPELYNGEPMTYAGNVFSFAIIMWQLLTKKYPFDGKFSPKLFNKLREGFRLPLPSSLPPPFKSLIKSCWHVSPDKRPSFKQIVEALQQIQKEGPPKLKLDHSNSNMYRKAKTIFAYKSKDPITVLKDWGRNKGKPNSMLIASEGDDLYMCDIEVFESSYEPASRPNEYRKVGVVYARVMPEAFAIKTENGSIEQGNAGDYLVQNEQFDQWTCDAKTFNSIYEQIDPQQVNQILHKKENELANVKLVGTGNGELQPANK